MFSAVRGAQVLAPVHAQRGLAGAEHIVGGANARRDVLVPGDAVPTVLNDERLGEPHRTRRRRALELRDEARAEPDAALAGRVPAPRPVEPERALQGEPPDRPLILRVERVEHDAVALGLRLADRDLIRDSAVEPVLHLRAVGIGPLIVDEIRALIPELHVVGTGHVGRGGAIRVVELLERRRRAEAAIGEVGERHAGGRVRGLFDHGNRVRACAVRNLAAPFARELRDAGFEQEPVRHGRRVVALENPLAVVPVPGRLWGGERAPERNPVVARLETAAAGRQAAALAGPLPVDEEAELVPWCRLARQPDLADLLGVGGANFDSVVRDVLPGAGVHVRVGAHIGHRRVLGAGLQRAVEPELVAHDGPAHRIAHIPLVVQLRERYVLVAALRPRTRSVAEHSAAEGVAAGLRDQIDARGAAVGLARCAANGHDDFRCGRGVIAELGGAAAVEDRADVHAVDLNGALVAVAPTGREHGHPWVRAGIHDLEADAGNRHEEVADAARGG